LDYRQLDISLEISGVAQLTLSVDYFNNEKNRNFFI
jgi:hypothetical protein